MDWHWILSPKVGLSGNGRNVNLLDDLLDNEHHGAPQRLQCKLGAVDFHSWTHGELRICNAAYTYSM